MKFIYKLFRKDPESRDAIISMTSGLGIVVNVLIAAVKVLIGWLTSSIAIISEGVNNAADVASSLLTLVGSKLATKHPDEKHPFGYGRIEYLTSLVIAVLILVSGVEMLKSAVELIFAPQELEISYISLAIVAGSAVIKLFLGLYTMKMGKKADSGALYGVGVECRNDSFVSIVTIVSAALFLIFGWNIDAYAGVITSLFILKAGFDLLKETISELLGRPGDKALASKIYKMVRSTPGIVNAADMMLHNYGPDAYSGSVNVEIDHKMTIGEAYQFLHALQLKIMHEEKVTMVFGIYAVDSDHEEMRRLRTDVASYIKAHEHIVSYHAIYLDSAAETIYCDLTVDYKLRDWDSLREEFTAYMAERYPGQKLELTIETDYV